MKSSVHTGASLLLKVAYEDGTEKVIGFARSFTYSVVQGQKLTYVVDSSTPVEIAQGAAPSFVKGAMSLYLPKGTTPEAAGLVPFRLDGEDNNIAMLSKYLHFRVYDRATLNLVFAAEYCKVGSYSVSMQARGIIEMNLQFDGIISTPGLAI